MGESTSEGRGLAVRGRSPVGRLFVAAGTATVLVALTKALYLASVFGVGRIRDYGSFFVVRGVMEAAGFSRPTYLAWMSWAYEPFELSTGAEFVRFFAAALLANLLLAGLVVLLLSPAAALGARFLGRHKVGFAATAFVAFLLPEAMLLVDRNVDGAIADTSILLAGVLVSIIAAWWIAVLLQRVRVGRRNLGGLVAAATTLVASIALAAGAISASIGQGQRVSAHAVRLAGKPNVLFISIDTLRADHVRSYGYARDTSPNLDRLSAEGTRFENVVSPSPWTLPSHLTMLTALPPEAHGVILPVGLKLDSAVWTLPEVLSAAGYATAGFVSGSYLDAQYGYAQGFDHYDDYSISYLCDYYRSCITSPWLFDLVESHLDEWHEKRRERPFFVFLHMWDVHNDYLPPEPYDKLFLPDGELDFTVGMIMDGLVDSDSVTPEQRDRMVALYDGEIRYTDEWIGRVIEKLEELAILDETIVVVTSDHGEEFREHGNWGHHRTLYDESVMVPLVLRFPGKIPAGKVVAQQVALGDLAPTLLALLEVEMPEEFGSAFAARDLTPLLTDDPPPDWKSSPSFGNLHGHLTSIRTPRWKLIRDEEGSGALELYDLRKDPGELHNLASTQPEVAERLSAALTAWRARWLEGAGHSDSFEQSEQHLDKLRALGYIE